MLDHVALGQARFLTPGLTSDSRGVALGRLGALLFPSLEALISWMRLFSADAAFEELVRTLVIFQVTTPQKDVKLVVLLQAQSSRILDQISRKAQLVSASTYTGAERHFVRVRDHESPYGYDAEKLAHPSGDVDFVLYDKGHTYFLSKQREVALGDLLRRLSLERVSPNAPEGSSHVEVLLMAREGLARGVLRYLWRNRVVGEVALVALTPRSSFAQKAKAQKTMLFRIRELPVRMLTLFRTTPGIDVFQPITRQVAVEIGYRHVINLRHCTAAFDHDGLLLFKGGEDRTEVLDVPLEFSSTDDLADVEVKIAKEHPISKDALALPQGLALPLTLAPSPKPPTQIRACFVRNESKAWLKSLIFALPQSALQGHQIVVTDRGVLVIAADEQDLGFPLGSPLSEVAPGIFIPLGMDFIPRVHSDVLTGALSHGSDDLSVFPKGHEPFRVSKSALVSLERASVAGMEVKRVEPLDTSVQLPGPPVIVNESLGRFALWGFKAPED